MSTANSREGVISHLPHLPHFYHTAGDVPRHWLHGFYKILSISALIFIFLNVGLYFLSAYYTLPMTKVGTQPVGMMPKASAIALIEADLANKHMTVRYKDTSTSLSYQELGIEFDAEETFNDLRRVEGFTSLPLMKLATNSMVGSMPSFSVDMNLLQSSLEDVVENIDKQPIDAQLVVPVSALEEITISKSRNGRLINPEIAAEQVMSRLQGATNVPDTITVSGRVLLPEATEDDLKNLLVEIDSLIAKPITVTDSNGKKMTTIDPVIIRQMVTNNGQELAFDQDKLHAYIREELALYFFKAPLHERVQKTGSVEKILVKGRQGKTVDIEDAMQVFNTSVLEGERSVSLKSAKLQPAIVKNGIYPKTEIGLHALISDFDAEKAGDYRIVVHQLTDDGLRATHQAAIDTLPASTYKAMIAYSALWSIEQGEMTLDDMTNKWSVRDCMYEMIHISTDFCAWAIQDYMGWDYVDEIIHAAGLTHTTINNEDYIKDKHTTAQDEFKLLKGLYDGTLLNGKHTNHLLTLMKEQMWRSGIPGGSSPAVVADKVGFYLDYRNDVGIVYAPKSDYIIVAMSKGGSFYEINELSRRVYTFFGN